MSNQKFTASQREAIWLAHEKKCAYTREPIDLSSCHIDHILPESLIDDPVAFERIKVELGLPANFDIFGYGNLLPCRPGTNLQKGSLVFDPAHTHFFLGITSSKETVIEASLKRIENRKVRGKALILLQQCLERGELAPSEVAEILEKHTEQPEEIFQLIEGMKFSDATEVKLIAKTEIDVLRDRPIRLGQNDHIDGITLTNDRNEHVHVRTCREYDTARQSGFYAYSNYDIKMSGFLSIRGLWG
jgi:hypothetical protein